MNTLEDILQTEEGQYRYDIFRKLNFDFKPSLKILDVGCGSGYNSRIFRDVFKLDVKALDVYKHTNIEKFGLSFELGSVFELPFADKTFDYVYAQDVLHHVDEQTQARPQHEKALQELARVVKPDGYIIIVEANRYNPLFYPHMVKLLGHDHFRHEYLVDLLNTIFKNFTLKLFEIHYYNSRVLWLWRFYETVMEKFAPRSLLAYTFAIIKGEAVRA